MKSLYFAALVLPAELCLRVQSVKDEFAAQFGTRHGLHTVPHITILPPFPMEAAGLEPLQERLAASAQKLNPFSIELDGFGRFDGDVLFIQVVVTEDLRHTHRSFQDTGENSRSFHPHVTVAHRDLKPGMLKEAWAKYKDREFKAVFNCESISLLKLEDGSWKIVKDFRFGGD